MAALASLDDLEVVLGYEPPDAPRAERLIEYASAAVETWCGRSFAYIADDEVTITVGRTGAMWLPNGPVVSIDSITDVDGDTVDADTYSVGRSGYVARPGSTWPPGDYIVIYSRAYQDVPADVVEVVCSLVAGRLGGVSPGLGSESLGDWSGTALVPFGTAKGDQEILQRLRPYKRVVGRIEVL